VLPSAANVWPKYAPALESEATIFALCTHESRATALPITGASSGESAEHATTAPAANSDKSQTRRAIPWRTLRTLPDPIRRQPPMRRELEEDLTVNVSVSTVDA